MGRIDPWAVRWAGGLAHGDRRIHASLHERDLQSVEAGQRATGGPIAGGWRYGGRESYARETGPAGPAIRVGVHAFIRRLTDGRPCLCRPFGRSGPALHSRQRSAGRADPIREARRFVARLVVAERTQPSGHRPRSRRAGHNSGANDREASLRSGPLTHASGAYSAGYWSWSVASIGEPAASIPKGAI